MRRFIGVLLIVCMALALNGAALAVDLNQNGLATPFPTEPTPGLAIAMIQTGSYEEAQGRLTGLGYSVTLVPPTAGISVFKNFGVIYLPLEWAQAGGDLAVIEARASDYHTYVQFGGGLFVEQPNPYMQPGDMVTPSVLPYPITFHNSYNDLDWPPVIEDATHEITQGLTENEMPFPADQMSSVDPAYEILVSGRETGSPSLVVGEYGLGRILVETAHPSATALYPFSDEVYIRMANWVGPAPTSELTQINLVTPANGAVLSAPPTFSWTVDGGTSNRYALDFSPSPIGPWFSTWDNLHMLIDEESIDTNPILWSIAPSGIPLYWRVRGADTSQTPISIITSDEVWSFTKQ